MPYKYDKLGTKPKISQETQVGTESKASADNSNEIRTHRRKSHDLAI